MRRLAALGMLAAMACGCDRLGLGSPVAGTYYVSNAFGVWRDYGLELRGDGTMRSFLPEGSALGTYTLAGSTVTFCIAFMCRDLEVSGDCLVQAAGERYCKDP